MDRQPGRKLTLDIMFGFTRSFWKLCTLAFLRGLTNCVLAGGTPTVRTIDSVGEASVDSGLFSSSWLEKFNGEKQGCGLGRGHYVWRASGLGSNLNNMLNAWVYYLTMQEWSDLSLISDNKQFQGLDCLDESKGLVAHGWKCLFNSMPHLCIFDTSEDWTNHIISANVSAGDLNSTTRITPFTIRQSHRAIDTTLRGSDIDHLGALAVMTKYVWNNMTPWLRNDVSFVTHSKKAVNGSPFLGIHVRRGDKLIKEATAIAVEEYLKAAVDYAEKDITLSVVGGIKAIWVASDDPAIVDEVRTLAPAYFPNVPNRNIVYAAAGVAGGANTTGVTTITKTQGYGSFVYIMADLEQLAVADIFVGTCSSNVGRLVTVLREGFGKPRNSSMSMDMPWHPGR